MRKKYCFVIQFPQSSSKKEEEKDDDEVEEEEAGVPHPLVTTYNISRDEIPSIPTNGFLSRVGPDHVDKPNYEKRGSRARGKTKSGRTIKGRGTLVRINKKYSPTTHYML